MLGAGGMGEVYRARDAQLNRDVALKILPAAFAVDGERLARFRREAQMLASLNHQNIGHIYGFEEPADAGPSGLHALVLELVEGPTLADRLASGPMPVEDALAIARQVAEALAAAHEQGIVHRDLKPANIKLRPDGVVKVLDFGLARAVESSATRVDLSNSPTITTPAHMTAAGTILGTAAYMSPEQAKGRPADTRSDIWAFGCVLFEMLAGVRTFPGNEVAEVLAGVIKDEPRWASLPPRTSPVLLRLLGRCLQKDPRRRLQHIGDAQFDLDESAGAPAGDSTVRGRSGERLAWAVLAMLLAAAAVVSWFYGPGSATPVANELRFEVATPPTTDPLSLAISPDGRNLVFAADNEGRSKLWLHALNELSSRPLAGTEGGFYPFWSPDGRSIAFFSGGKLNRLDLEGGLVRPISNAPNPVGGSWGRDGTILFSPNFTGPIYSVAATGGDVTQITRTDESHSSHRFPLLLPDGRHFLYYVPGGEASRGVYVASLDGGSDTRLLGHADAPAVFVPPRRLIFVSAGKLLAQPFDPQTRTLSGTPSPVADQVVAVGDSAQAGLSASAAGALVYRAGAGKGQRQLIWFDRAGKPLGTAADPDDAGVEEPSMSPDGRRVGISKTTNGNTDVWILDLDRRLLSRFTYDGAAESVPIWSPDGTKIVFNSNRGGRYNLYVKAASGTGSEELLLQTEQNKAAVDWSPDGRLILFRSPSLSTGFDLWALPLEGDRRPFPVVQTMFEERDGQFSPDGNWIAYQSNESGRMEIFVQSFPGPGGKIQVSTGGGAQVRWRKDGRELFYIALDGKLMAVPIRRAGSGSIEAGAPVALFATRVGGAIRGTYLQQYVVSPNGDRFLMNTVTNEASVAPVTVILNWRPPSAP